MEISFRVQNGTNIISTLWCLCKRSSDCAMEIGRFVPSFIWKRAWMDGLNIKGLSFGEVSCEGKVKVDVSSVSQSVTVGWVCDEDEVDPVCFPSLRVLHFSNLFLHQREMCKAPKRCEHQDVSTSLSTPHHIRHYIELRLGSGSWFKLEAFYRDDGSLLRRIMLQ